MAREGEPEERAAAGAGDVLTAGPRVRDDYAPGRVPGARLMPPCSVPARRGELPADRPVYVICANGGHGRAAAAWTNSLGIGACSTTGGSSARARGGRRVAAGPVRHAA